MNLLLVIIISLGISLSMDEILTLDIYKKLANRGYLPVVSPKDISNIVYDNKRLDSVIPIYNILKRLFRYMIFNRNIYNNIGALMENEIIRKMDDSEIKLYCKNRSGISALKMQKYYNELVQRIQTIYIKLNNDDVEIKYMIDDDNKLQILNLESDLLKKGYSKKELEDLLFKSWTMIYTNGFILERQHFFKRLKKSGNMTVIGTKDPIIKEIDAYYNYTELLKLEKYFDTNVEDTKLSEYKNLPKMVFINLDNEVPNPKTKIKKL